MFLRNCWYAPGDGGSASGCEEAAPVSNRCVAIEASNGATRRIRTDDLLITNQLLYQLS